MKEYRLYSDDEIARLGDKAFNYLVQKEARGMMVICDRSTPPQEYHRDLFEWGEPITEQCLDCYEWRRYPPNQRHFGYAWWGKCDMKNCKCEHHKTEIWFG